MKQNKLVITFLSVAAFAMGCKQEDTTSQQFAKVQTETKEAAQDMKDYTFAQKAEFTEKMQGQLAEINRDLDQIQRCGQRRGQTQTSSIARANGQAEQAAGEERHASGRKRESAWQVC